MTDYRRLSSLVSSGNSVTDPKQSYRSNSRHWLAVARAVDKETPGGLSDEEKQRLEDALTDLNHDVYGGGDTTPDVKAAKSRSDKSDDTKPDRSKSDKSDSKSDKSDK